jgi:hypothetical protein
MERSTSTSTSRLRLEPEWAALGSSDILEHTPLRKVPFLIGHGSAVEALFL